MKHLDQLHRALRRLHGLSEVKMAPSDNCNGELKWLRLPLKLLAKATGWSLANGAEDLSTVASDYPHQEGTDEPILLCERSLDGTFEAKADEIYQGRFRPFCGACLDA